MSKNWTYLSGQHNAICDSCGRKFKSSQLRKRWDGLMVCQEDYEQRHPMDFLRVKPDKITPAWTRPQLPEVFVPVTINLLDTVYLTEDFEWANVKPPIVESESVTITENINTSAEYYRIFPATGNQTDGVLHGRDVNFMAINASTTTYPDNSETITLSESVVTVYGHNKTASDTITLSETVVPFKFISNPINQQAVNASFIG